MDTKPLEGFAKAARRELISAVEAQASAVLATGSVARTERAETVRRLEDEISEHGRKHVIDKVAYTWFNRLIALRFMDAKGYTGVGVVSPVQGQTHGQPEILADAKRGEIDTEVVTSTRTQDAIIGLLDGTRRSTDAEGEAYALLLTEYCRHWYMAMPFMFEREGYYTELLVPAGLLADGAILSRARAVLTEDVCDDVEVIGWLYQFYISERKDEVFAGFKKSKKAGSDEIPAATQLFTPHWIVRYLVENSLGRLWMLNRPNSRIIDQMEYYIAPDNKEAGFLKITGPEDLSVIDPACGSGHMLTYAFDLLYAIYEEAGYAPSEIPSLILTHNLYGTEIDPRAGALAAFALAMKARTKDRRYFTRDAKPQIFVIEPILFGPDELDFLVTKSGDRHEEETFWNQFRDADTLGSLIRPDAEQTKHAAALLLTLDDNLLNGQTLEHARKAIQQAEVLSHEYMIAVANPPYMGSKNMDSSLTEYAKSRYPDAKSDLMTMFMKRSATLVRPGGWWGMINLPSWMSLSSFEELRGWLLQNVSIDTVLHLGRGVFGSDFGSVGFVVENCPPSPARRGLYRKLFDKHVEVRSNAKIEALFRDSSYQNFVVAQHELEGIPGSPIAYWLSPAMRSAFEGTIEHRAEKVAKGIGRDPLSNAARVAKGITTGENAKYLRFWWEVDQGNSEYDRTSSASESRHRWVAADKGGEFRRWYGNNDYVIDWYEDGLPIINSKSSTPRNLSTAFQRAVACSKITSGEGSFRFHSGGHVFTDAAVSMTGDSADLEGLGAFLNSSTASLLLSALAPTLNFEVGQIRSLPNPDKGVGARAASNAQSLVIESRRDWDDFECSWDFNRPSWFSDPMEATFLLEHYSAWSTSRARNAREQQSRETANNRIIAEAFGLQDEVPISVPLHRVSLTRNVEFRYGPEKSAAEYEALERADFTAELISYAVGCMFGRYSLDKPGLILADQGSTLQDYLAKVSSPTFAPDADNAIPFVDDGWFEDDIVERSRQFLRTAFGTEHFEENLRFVEESLGVKTLRDYFITKLGKSKFYDDHIKRYKKRPIYWMFSSPKGSFNALIYMHRYTPSTVSTVLNEYLREYEAKLSVALQQAEAAASGGGSAKDQKEADRLLKLLAELRDYEHDVLYPFATQQIEIDLDDGVKVNYPKFYPAVKNITGLEASDG
ncbi:BREX-1 system adenine-specific DNA-methyltransferase PglX [Paeniglutamicibacter gangotriensis]|uniref:BREX-1 system adenine-specific DNA-methyltransferase PglX n=1 Tax=Paeniglutamicibacter gangotriensis TaxID=254787 RepID=UPI0037C57863